MATCGLLASRDMTAVEPLRPTHGTRTAVSVIFHPPRKVPARTPPATSRPGALPLRYRGLRDRTCSQTRPDPQAPRRVRRSRALEGIACGGDTGEMKKPGPAGCGAGL